MVKQINIILDDEEHKQLSIAKGEMTWREVLLKLLNENGGLLE